jgi:uncharacterized membrane protein YbhN (UPF0104 family)
MTQTGLVTAAREKRLPTPLQSFRVSFIHATGEALARASAPLVLLALCLHIGGLVVTGERWRVILTRLGSPISLGRAILVNLAGIFVRNVMPASGVGGDAVRIGLFRAGGASLADAAVALVCGRLAEVPAIVVLVIAALPAIGAAILRFRPAGWTWALALAGVGIFMVFWGPAAAYLGRARERFGVAMPPAGALAAGTAWATVSWLETAVRLMLVSAALGVRLTVPQGAALTVFSIVGGLVPTVGSLGAIEGSLMAGLVLFGVTPATATAITVVERAITYVFSTAAGGAALVAIGGWDLAISARRSGSYRHGSPD